MIENPFGSEQFAQGEATYTRFENSIGMYLDGSHLPEQVAIFDWMAVLTARSERDLVEARGSYLSSIGKPTVEIEGQLQSAQKRLESVEADAKDARNSFRTVGGRMRYSKMGASLRFIWLPRLRSAQSNILLSQISDTDHQITPALFNAFVMKEVANEVTRRINLPSPPDRHNGPFPG